MPDIDQLTADLEAAISGGDLAAVEEAVAALEEATKEWESNPPEGGLGEKCGDEPKMEGMPSRPYQGAKTFGEADALISYNRDEGKVSEQIGMFHALEANIWADEELSLRQKMDATQSLIEELSGRIENPPEYKEEGILERLKTLLGLGTDPLRGSGEKAETKTEDGKGFPAGDYAYVPDADKPSTWKLRLTSTPGGPPDPKIVGAAIAAFSPGGFRGQPVQIPAADVAAAKAKVRAAWAKAHPDMKTADMPMHIKELAEAELTDGVFTAWKSIAGDYRWFLTATNKFKDREAEIFSEAGHREFLGHLEASKEWPVLRVWHTPGADIGQAEWADYTDGFMVYAGRFNDGEEATAARLAAMGPQGVSHGYRYLAGEKEAGVYSWYRTFELTILPPHRAANQWGVGATIIGSKEEAEMPFTKEKRAYLLDVFGDEERVTRIEEGLAVLGKELEGKVAFKDLADAVADPDPKPEPEGEDDPAPEGDPEPEAEAEAPTAEARIGALETRIGEVSAQVEELVGATKALADGVKELLKSDEEKMVDALAPRRPAPRPTEDTQNIVDAAKEAAGEEEETPPNPVDAYLGQFGIGIGARAE